MNIGKKIRSLRSQNKFTLKELSIRTGLSISFISDIENNRRNPSLENLNKLAQALGVEVNFLLNDQNKQISGINDNEPIESDPDIRAIARAAQKMSPEQRKNLARFLEKAFDKAFDGE